MKKAVIKALIMLTVIIAVLLQMKVVNAATFPDVTENYKDTYIVQYGKEITIQKDENETIVSDNLDIAKIVNDKIRVVGTGHFTISVNDEKINFFAWNAYLKNTKYAVYEDKAEKRAERWLKAKTYLAVSKVENYKTLEIKDYLFTTGSYNGELKGKYIESYYNEKTKQSKTNNYEYSFEEDFIKISLDKDELTLTEGEKATVVATVEPEDLADKKVTFSSSNESIAKVNENGEITAVKAGEATITAEIRGKKATCDVTVKAKETKPTEPETPAVEENLEIYFLNVTKPNDAIFIKVGNKSIFVDGGHYENVEKVIIPYLNNLGVTKIDYYIGTHSHEEHVGAAGPLIKNFGIKKIYVSEATINKKYAYVKDSYFAGSKVTLTDTMRTSATYNQIYKAINDGTISGKTSSEQTKIKNAERKAVAKCKVGILKHGKEINIGNLKITCLGPVNPKAEQDIESNSNKTSLINNNSLILRLDYGEKSFLLTGDAGNTELKDTCEKYKEKVSVDLYKNGAHGSAKTEAIMNNIAPQYTIFETVDYKLPSKNFLDMITKIGNSKYTYQNGYKPYYITAGGKDGNIFVKSNGKTIEIKTHYKEKNIIPIDSITLRSINNLQVGDKVTLTSYTTIRPSYATDKTIEYTSSNPDVARIIGDNGIVLEALKEGKTVITAKVDGGKKTASIEVEVIKQKLEVHFINTRADKIGSRSDAIFIKVGNKSIIVDGGLYEQASTVTNYIKKLGVKKVDYYMGSHAHKDHVGAAGQLIQTFKISKMYVSEARLSKGKYSKNATINRMFTVTEANTKASSFKREREYSAIRNCKQVELKHGTELNINGLKIKCIGPINPVTDSKVFQTNNRNSLMLRLEYGEAKHSFLLVGDAGTMSREGSLVEYEEANAKYPGSLDVDVYKNGHHGNAKSEQIVKWITPKYTVFLSDSFAKNTIVSIDDYLKYLEKVGSKQYIVSSKYNGHVVFESDGKELTVKAEKDTKKLELSNASVYVGEEKKLTVNVIPVTLDNINITWKSSDSKIATISKDGVVKGIKEGKVTITAEAKGYKKATCTVTVKQKEEKKKILFIGNSKTYFNNFREDCIQIATRAGYKFEGKETSGDYSKINIHSTKNVSDSYYSITIGGSTLINTWNKVNGNTQLLAALKNTKVDYVVMQQGTKGMADYDNYYKGAEKFLKVLVTNNPDVKVYIRNIWCRCTSDEKTINECIENTRKVIKNLNAAKICKNEIKIINDGPVLYDAHKLGYGVFVNSSTDTVHQTKLGAYASALITDATIFGIDVDSSYVPEKISKSYANKDINEIKALVKKYINWNGTYKFPKESDPVQITEFDQRNKAVVAYFNDSKRNISSIFKKYCKGSSKIRGDQPSLYTTKISSSKVILSLYNQSTGAKTDTKTINKDNISYYMIPGNTYCLESEDKKQAEYIKITGTKRMIYVPGVYNVRDLGGMQADNGTLKYGKIFRGADPYKIKNEDIFNYLKIGVIVNLRSESSYKKSLSHFPSITKVNAPPGMYLNSGNPRKAIRYIMNNVVDNKNVFFHCAVGTDRTGTVAYLTEGLLGVTLEERLDDYELSYFFRETDGHGKTRTVVKNGNLYKKVNKYSSNNKEQEKFMNWYLEGSKNKETEVKLINNFRKAMIDGNPTEYKLSGAKVKEK